MYKSVIFSANRGYALRSSREALIRHFIINGWRVILVTADDEDSRYLVRIGAVLEPVCFSRGGLSLLGDWRAWRRFKAIITAYKPVLVHNFHAKPVIFGSLAARRRLGSDVRIVNTITGLGHAFIAGGWIRHIAGLGYKIALSRSDQTIFQNNDDRDLFVENAWSRPDDNRVIVGSGVDLSRFRRIAPIAPKKPVTQVVMLGRMIWQKGVAEFAKVAGLVRAQYPDVRFVWAGELDPEHPDAVSEVWLAQQREFDYIGRIQGVQELLEHSGLMLFPSYREGVPRAVMEAAAMGLPCVGFDVPGVREAVVQGETGYLVPSLDVHALYEATLKLLENDEIRNDFGRSAYQHAVECFDIKSVIARYVSTYREIGVDIPNFRIEE